MVVKLYYDAMSQPSRALVIFLRMNAKVIPVEEAPVALRKGEHLTPEFALINPLKKVPVIDHDGFVLTESVSILRYLCRTFPVPDHWYPKDSKAQARVDEYMAWQHLNLRAMGSIYFRSKLIDPMLTGEPVNEKKLNNFGVRLKEVLDSIETVWLKDNPFIAGKEMSIADLLASTEMEQPGMAGYDVYEGHPKISKYMQNVKSRLEPHYSDAHSIVHKLQKKAKL